MRSHQSREVLFGDAGDSELDPSAPEIQGPCVHSVTGSLTRVLGGGGGQRHQSGLGVRAAGDQDHRSGEHR